MSTEAQINAYRQNAQKSTGPKTAEGKAVVAQNAVKHGLFASENVINGENQDDFDQFREELLAELTPVGTIESMLAARIVGLSWRLKRSERMHNEAIDVMIAWVETSGRQRILRRDAGKAQDPRAGGLELILGWATKNDFSDSRVLERLLMYERRIENSLYKTMNELQKRQLMRELEQAEAADAERAPEPCPPADKRSNCEKQSQFAAAVDASSFLKEGYGNKPSRGHQENEPRKETIKASLKPAPASQRGRKEVRCQVSEARQR